MSRAVFHTGQGPVTLADKDPHDSAWYAVVWDEALEGVGISSSTWLTELSVASSLTNHSLTLDGVSYGKVNKVLLAGGQAGKSYLVTNRVTTSDAQQLDRSFYITVAEQ